MKIEKLIERIKAGDADALRTVYETYSQRMRNVCIRITREDEATVSDLVQESFIRAYYSLGKLKDASKFGEWIVAITKNVSLRYLERKQKVQVMPFLRLLMDLMWKVHWLPILCWKRKNFSKSSTSYLLDIAKYSRWQSLKDFRIRKLRKTWHRAT